MATLKMKLKRCAMIVSQRRHVESTLAVSIAKKWIQTELVKSDSNTDRFIDVSGQLNLNEFTPSYFEMFFFFCIRDGWLKL